MSDDDNAQSTSRSYFCEYPLYAKISPPIFAIAAIALIPLIFIFIKAYMTKKMMIKSPFLFYVGVMLFLMIFTEFVSMSVWTSFECYGYKFNSILHQIVTQLFIIQTLVFLGALFYKLYTVFRETRLRLSRFTSTLWMFMYGLTAVLCIVSGFAYSLYRKSFLIPILSAFVGILLMILIVFVIFMYLYKLVIVYKSSSQDTELLALITKTSLLASISIFVSIFTFILVALLPVINSPHFGFAYNIIVGVDMYSNFLSIFLSYRYFENFYFKLCHCCNSKCQYFWTFCMHKSMADKRKLEMVVNKSVTEEKEPSVLSISRNASSFDHIGKKSENTENV